MRLNQFIAHAGICSRRKADLLVERGAIKVNGIRAEHPGMQVQVSDLVTYKGKRLSEKKKVYWLLNKPFNCITTLYDPQHRKTVVDYLPKKTDFPRIYPVGRLDRNTTGLLLMTNDGYLAKALAHPALEINKRYEVSLKRKLSHEDLEVIKKGVQLEDGMVKVDGIFPKDRNDTAFTLDLHSGKNRVIRRMFEQLNYGILALDRVEYAGITLEGLARGCGRFLTEKEVTTLYKKVGKATERGA